MEFDKIKEIARQHNIKAGKAKKPELVRAIQLAEGNESCFDNGKASQCGQDNCMWREECA